MNFSQKFKESGNILLFNTTGWLFLITALIFLGSGNPELKNRVEKPSCRL